MKIILKVMNIVAFIPARGGSKSVPQKNIRLLGGKPLIAYSIETALSCGLKPYVSTESEEVARIAGEWGAEVIMRPENLAQDDTSMYDLLKSEVPKIEVAPDLVILFQPTSPFRKNVHVKSAISYLAENLDKYDSLISVEKVPEKWHPAQVIVSALGGKRMADGRPMSKRLTRRQEFPEAWVPTGAIYLFKASNLDKGSIYGNEVMLLETESTININSLSDFEEAEKKL